MKHKVLLLAMLPGLMLLNGKTVQAQDSAAGIDPEGSLVYSLPLTSVRLQVEAQKETFHAGPYAKYAKKYLGIDAKQNDATSYSVVSVDMCPLVEADLAARFTVAPGAGMPMFLSMTSQGLVSVSFAASSDTKWRFPVAAKGDFSDKGLTSALTSESATLYRNVKSESSYNKVAIQQEMVVQKSLDAKAKEAAEMIFNLRKKRVQIVTGDTDATFSGEAMTSAINEISKLESEYMSMFIGYSEFSSQKMNYDVVPTKDNESQLYVAFRLSDSKGLVPADDLSGKPYLLEFSKQDVTVPADKSSKAKGAVAHYRVPSMCTVKLTDGVNVLLQSRIAVYQLGVESTFPLSK